jgi:hypothetical protein
MVQEFQNPRTGFMNHIYWKDLESTTKWMEKGRNWERDVGDRAGCVLM